MAPVRTRVDVARRRGLPRDDGRAQRSRRSIGAERWCDDLFVVPRLSRWASAKPLRRSWARRSSAATSRAGAPSSVATTLVGTWRRPRRVHCGAGARPGAMAFFVLAGVGLAAAGTSARCRPGSTARLVRRRPGSTARLRCQWPWQALRRCWSLLSRGGDRGRSSSRASRWPPPRTPRSTCRTVWRATSGISPKRAACASFIDAERASCRDGRARWRVRRGGIGARRAALGAVRW